MCYKDSPRLLEADLQMIVLLTHFVAGSLTPDGVYIFVETVVTVSKTHHLQ